MNIIFMGTPDFAVPSLVKLIDSNEHDVVSVFTQAPKPKGRGMKLTPSVIHDIAIENNIPVYTPKTLRNDKIKQTIEDIEADVIIVVAYGLIIPRNILKIKKYGCLNIHPSKLPKYRGAAPLQRTIINGEKESAVCIMQMDQGVDTGDIILQENFKLDPNINFSELHDKSSNIGANLLLNTLKNIDTLPKIKQSEDGASYAHKLAKEEGEINWGESAFNIHCKIRGMNPWPGAYFNYKGKIIKILTAEYTNNSYKLPVGELLNDNFEIVCGTGTLIIQYIKPEGKPKMPAVDYLRGL